MRINTIVSVILGLWLISGCVPTYESYYPSYEVTMAKYAPPGEQVAWRVDDSSDYPESEECDCPQVWYENHWVYYYHGSWIFWNHGYWYHYPYFDWYYFGYGPILYQGPGRVIVSKSKPKSEVVSERNAENNAEIETRWTVEQDPAETRDNSTPSQASPPSRPSTSQPSPRRPSPNRSTPSRSSSSDSNSRRK